MWMLLLVPLLLQKKRDGARVWQVSKYSQKLLEYRVRDFQVCARSAARCPWLKAIMA